MFTKFTAQWTSAGCLMQHCANIIKNSLELSAYRQSSTDLETIPSLILAALAKVANGLGRQFGIEHGSPLDEWNCFESGKVAFWQGSCHVCGNSMIYMILGPWVKYWYALSRKKYWVLDSYWLVVCKDHRQQGRSNLSGLDHGWVGVCHYWSAASLAMPLMPWWKWGDIIFTYFHLPKASNFLLASCRPGQDPGFFISHTQWACSHNQSCARSYTDHTHIVSKWRFPKMCFFHK